MALEQESTSTAPFEVNIVVGNINGRLSKGRGVRRDLIVSNVLQSPSSKPDFLAFQDGVQPIDIRTFVAALNERWPGSKYSHVPVLGDGTEPSKTNKEALLYDTNLWERATKSEESFYKACTDISLELLHARSRVGIFEQQSSENKLVVVSYHGATKSSKKEKDPFSTAEKKEAIFKSNLSQITLSVDMLEFLEDLIAYIDSKMPVKTSLLICGDFNFVVSRPGLTKYFNDNECEIWPKQQDRKRAIDFALVRGREINVLTCVSYHPSLPLPKQLDIVEHAAQPDSSLIVEDESHLNSLLQVKQEEEDDLDTFYRFVTEEEKKDEVRVSVREITNSPEGSFGLELH
jgi:hypothetical protein